ncbi:hypothetical protein [Crocosphaera sp. XPORK-15E]|uniref:hypothetical protein n=1 Tax=Crocosphaera sp. XPORK-15E TaxID=3110247 RepID=UPI002B2132A2|nr:hypothetical protein [Crocosphaera sp. XPORK-15E]MEA5535698.1 hypothetical protein [Crocosphaera sp. XPORK-15E]
MSSQLRFIAALTTFSFSLSMGVMFPAMAKSLRQYENINQKQFNECIKPPTSNGSNQGWAEYYGENNGKIELKVRNQPMISDGTVAATLSYKFEPSEKMLVLEIEEKTKFAFGLIQASDAQIWEGFDGLVEECRNHG